MREKKASQKTRKKARSIFEKEIKTAIAGLYGLVKECIYKTMEM